MSIFSMRMARRPLSLLSAALVFALILAACGGPAPAPAVEPGAADQPAVAAEAPAAPVGLPAVPRNRTHVVMQGGIDGQYVDSELWNPYAIGANHQLGSNIIYEPLAFYSAFADEEILWLAEGYEYNDDFTELTIYTRQGVTWSDGVPFSAEDVAYTLNTLKELGPEVRWGVDVQQFVEEAEVIDENTVLVRLAVPAPRFFYFMAYKFDIGVYMVPKHIFEGRDWTTFTAFDVDQGWPVTTGPFTVVAASPEQKIYDRRDSWWAAEQGLAPMPQIERIVRLPAPAEQQQAQAFITNEIDAGSTLQPTTFATIFAGNENIITHSGRESPYGYLDWWPISMYVNTSVPPFDNPDVRWALSLYIDRDQVVEFGWSGANTVSRLPMPPYPPLMRYFDAVEHLLEEYNTSEFNPEKADALLEGAGYTKGSDGYWVDADGVRMSFEALIPQFLSGMGLTVVEQLRNAGVELTPATPPDITDRFTRGDYQIMFYGHGGSVRDPYFTMRLYQGASQAVPGQHLVNFSKWTNEDYDNIVDEVFITDMEDYDRLEELFVQAMEIWLPELPDIPLTELYHRIGYNTTYWTNWPTDDNPYVNGASWHLTHLMVLWNLEAVE